MIKIFQINGERDINRHAFRPYNFIKEFDFSIYDKIWEGEVPSDYTLENIFDMFNLNHPNDYNGHSLSVSDVVQVIELSNVEAGFYYCDSFGWRKLNI